MQSTLKHQAPWLHNLMTDTQICNKRIEARWPFWIIGTNDSLIALTFSDTESMQYAEYLNRQGFTIVQSPTSDFMEETATILRDFMETGKPFHVTALNFYLIRTEFARQVLTWTGLVPFGKTATYGQIANWMGRPTAARGVGGALHANPLSIVIPCHRIIGAGGNLVGFGGGLEMKRKLLELEGSYPSV